MSIFDSIFNKAERAPVNKTEGESNQTYKDKLNERLYSEKVESVENLTESYNYLLSHAEEVGLSKSDMEEVLLSQIERKGISPEISSETKGPGFELKRKIAFLLEDKFGSTKLVEKIRDKYGLNYHLGDALYSYIDLDSYPDIKKLSSEKIYLFVQSGVIKIEDKYTEEFIDNVLEKATMEFVLKNINPDIVKSTKQELEKIASFIKEEEIKSDIISTDNIFKEETSSENKAINLEI